MKSRILSLSKVLTLICLSALLSVSCDNSGSSDSDFDSGIEGPLNPFEQNIALGRGVNLGNMLEAPRNGDWGEVVIPDNYFEMIADAGFNSVRMPVRFSDYAPNEAPYAIEDEILLKVDRAVQLALENDLMIIIDMHHYEEIFDDPVGNRNKFLAMWEQISDRYKEKPKEVVFEILNEPHDELTAELWNGLLPQALDVIREDNPYRTVIIGAAEWGGISGLRKLEIPQDSNIIVTVHYYEPFQFTHQGASWVNNGDANEWLGTTWDATPSEVAAIEDHFDEILEWGESRNVPINIGEFGAYSRAPMDSRVRWTRTIVQYALRNDMSFHYWEFSKGFGIYDPSNNTWHTELANSLLNTTAKVPAVVAK